MTLEKETPEAKSWVYDLLLRYGIRLPTVEGYSVKGGAVTALFERLRSTVSVQKWSAKEISQLIVKYQDVNDWLDRIVLASTLNVQFYLALWQDRKEEFRVLLVTKGEEGYIEVEDKEFFSSCDDLARWMSDLKGIQVSKRFIERGRLSSIDECLRAYGVPWPGNLDGFLLSNRTHRVNVVFELSRTRKFPVRTHNLNLYFSQDINRWKPLDILRKQLNVPLLILIWSSDETLVKVHHLRELTDEGLDFEKTEILEEGQIVPWFRSFLD